MTTWLWIALFVVAAWVAIAYLFGRMLGAIVRKRDEQVPRDPDSTGDASPDDSVTRLDHLRWRADDEP